MRKGQETPGAILIPLVFAIILSIFLLFDIANNLTNLSGSSIASIILALMLLSSLPFSWTVYARAGIKPRRGIIFYYIFGNILVMFLIFSIPLASSIVAFLFVVISPYFWKFEKVYSYNQLKSKKMLVIIGLLILSGVGMAFSNLLTSGLIVLIYYPLMIYAIQELTRTSQLQHTKVVKGEVTSIRRPLRFMIKMTPYEYLVIGSFFVLFSLFQFYANFSLTGQPFTANFWVVMFALLLGVGFIYYGNLTRESSKIRKPVR